MHAPVDLRSDTVTRPSPAMRAAMAAADVGDDVFGDDPSVLRLEAHAAQLLGKEAGLFFPSGTMANLAAAMAQTSHVTAWSGLVVRTAGTQETDLVDGGRHGRLTHERTAPYGVSP